MNSIDKKNLSYQGKALQRRQLLLDNISSINETWKYEKLGITLIVANNGNTLAIQYRDHENIRRKISPPKVELSPAGLEVARSISHRIANALSSGTYTAEWLQGEIYGKKGDKVPILTWHTVQAQFSDKWLAYRSGDTSSTDRQKQRTLTNYLCQLGLISKDVSLPHETPFNATFVKLVIDLHPEGTNKRFRYRETLSIACTLFGIAYDFSKIGKRPKPKERELPSDEEIIAIYNRFDGIFSNKQANDELIPCHKWLYGVLATYGLRPQELFAIDLEKSFKAESDYWITLNESLVDGLKTGNRSIAPLHPDWVKLFDLTSIQYPPSISQDVSRHVKQLGEYWRIHKVGITPYCLRHAYAIRCRKLGVPLLDASDLLGHDPATHHKQYHRWIGDDDRRASIKAALMRNNAST